MANTHSFVDGGIALVATVSAGIALAAGAPALATGIVIGGAVVGVASMLGADWVDDITDDWVKDFIYDL